MRSRRDFTTLVLVASISFAARGRLSSQAGPAKFMSHVYAWLPNNTVRRISPGPDVSGNAAMSAGPFIQAAVLKRRVQLRRATLPQSSPRSTVTVGG